MTAGKLRLRAESPEDLEVVGGVLQDALLPLSDMVFLREEGRFALVANRFCWEAEERENAPGPGERSHLRVNCGLLFSQVEAVQTRGFDRDDTANILSLLTIQTEPGVDASEITLICAGDASIRLKVRSIDCRLGDMGEPWPTVWRPSHGDDEAD